MPCRLSGDIWWRRAVHRQRQRDGVMGQLACIGAAGMPGQPVFLCRDRGFFARDMLGHRLILGGFIDIAAERCGKAFHLRIEIEQAVERGHRAAPVGTVQRELQPQQCDLARTGELQPAVQLLRALVLFQFEQLPRQRPHCGLIVHRLRPLRH